MNIPLPREELNASKLLGCTFSAVVATEHQACDISVTIRIGEKVLEFGDDDGIYFSPDSKNVIILLQPIEMSIVDDLTHTS